MSSTCPFDPCWAPPNGPGDVTAAEWLESLLRAVVRLTPRLEDPLAFSLLGDLALQLLCIQEMLRSAQTLPPPEQLPQSPEGQLLAEVALQLHALYLVNGISTGDESCFGTHAPRILQ